MSIYNELEILTVNNLFKLQLFRFLNLLLNGCLPMFYDLLMVPLLSRHNYSTRAGRFRHPLVVCEVERRAVAHQLILMYDAIGDSYYDVCIGKAIKKYKRFLLSEQQRWQVIWFLLLKSFILLTFGFDIFLWKITMILLAEF